MNDDFALRRAAARALLDAIDPHKQPGGAEADPKRRGWFEAVYDLARDDPAGVPWANLAPHPLLAQWLAGQGPLDSLRAVDVGCGLGDNAEAIAAVGAKAAAFDLVERAIMWAKRRFPASAVDYRVADLFSLPQEWRSAFDLVHECYTLQALPSSLLASAAHSLAWLVAPGGRLLVIARARNDEQELIARARNDEQELHGPPWPLTRAQIEALAVDGLRLETLEEIPAEGDRSRHWRATLRRESAVTASSQ